MSVVDLVPGREAPAAVLRGVHRLLVEVDQEFVPPLSHRTDTLSLRTEGGAGASGVATYLEAMQAETWLVARDGEHVRGLLSFVAESDNPHLPAWSPSLYATTVAVLARSRHEGVCGLLYDAFEAAAADRGVPHLSTRTWHTNTGHLRLLHARGFTEVTVLPDDRGPGVHTVYLARRTEPHLA